MCGGSLTAAFADILRPFQDFNAKVLPDFALKEGFVLPEKSLTLLFLLMLEARTHGITAGLAITLLQGVVPVGERVNLRVGELLWGDIVAPLAPAAEALSREEHSAGFVRFLPELGFFMGACELPPYFVGDLLVVDGHADMLLGIYRAG